MSPRKLPPLLAKHLSSWKLVERFNSLLNELGAAVAPSSRESHGLRKLDLLAESLARQPGGLKFGRFTPELIHLFDSTIWKVVRRMNWAQWREQHGVQRPGRLHLKLRLSDLAPAETVISAGNICARAAMRLGSRGGGGLHRIVIKHTPQMKEALMLVTSESRETLDALEVIGLYRHRWEIEKFFRWLKCLVPETGLTIMILRTQLAGGSSAAD